MPVKQLLFSLSFCLLTITTFSQSRKKIVKHKIGSIKVEISDSTGKSSVESIKKFDKRANLTYEEEYSKNGKLRKKKEQKFSPDNQLIEEIIYNPKGEIEEIIHTKYKLDLPVEISISDEKGELKRRVTILYNAYEEKIKEITYDKEGMIIQTTQYLYDNKGLKTSKKVMDAKGKLIEEKKYTYTFR